MDKDGNSTTTSITLTSGGIGAKFKDKDGNEYGAALAGDTSTAEETNKALAEALSKTDLGKTYNISGTATNIVFEAKEGGETAQVALTSVSVDGAAATTAATTRTTTGADAYTKLDATQIKAYDGKGNIEDNIFTVNGEKFAFVTDSTLLGDDYKDVNYVKTATATPGDDEVKTMASLIKAKTGIDAAADKGVATTINLKPSSTATGKGIELQIGANEGQTMSFTLDDMSADALGVGSGSVDLSTQDKAKTLLQLSMQLSRRYLRQEVRWVPFRTDLSTLSTTLLQLLRTFRQQSHVSVIQIWLKKWLTTARTAS